MNHCVIENENHEELRDYEDFFKKTMQTGFGKYYFGENPRGANENKYFLIFEDETKKFISLLKKEEDIHKYTIQQIGISTNGHFFKTFLMLRFGLNFWERKKCEDPPRVQKNKNEDISFYFV
jgi:hypothetical protein